jgi:hypothetical protein
MFSVISFLFALQAQEAQDAIVVDLFLNSFQRSLWLCGFL